MHNLWVFYYFFQKSLFTENYFLIAAINLTTRVPLYTCLVYLLSYDKLSTCDQLLCNRSTSVFEMVSTGIMFSKAKVTVLGQYIRVLSAQFELVGFVVLCGGGFCFCIKADCSQAVSMHVAIR